MDDLQLLSEEERDILQEVMNIAIGKASADLTEIIDIYVVLSIPEIMILKTGELPQYIDKEVMNFQKISLIKQNFTGKFHGCALLFFPGGTGEKLITLINDNAAGPKSVNEELSLKLEKELLLEIGSVLVGASVSKVAELLNDEVDFRPPKMIVNVESGEIADWDLAEPDGPAILMRTLFGFEERDVSGLILLVPSFNSFEWLKKSLHAFLQQYE